MMTMMMRSDTVKEHQPPLTTPSSSPSSPSSSPSHDFTFTISLHHTSSKPPTTPSTAAVDLSPADDIFFHGHLLPLHLLSHHLPPLSPRSSTNSIDSFSLPVKDLLLNHHPQTPNNPIPPQIESEGRRPKSKSSSFSLFNLPKWKKIEEIKGTEEKEKEKGKRKARFDVSDVLKKYLRMVRPLLSFRGGERRRRREAYSYSGNLSFRNNNKGETEMRGGGRRRTKGGFSAPASMRTSPANSGLLVATGSVPAASTSDSTMEELQAAIQAAIAHCKNSIAVEEKKMIKS